MTRDLTAGRKAPRSGTVKTVVVFLHGYGADGKDLLGLADPLSDHMPDTLFLAPNAPEPCLGNPMGFQWFPIPRMDGSDPVAAGVAFAAAQDDLNAYLDKMMEEEGVGASQVMLVGFSQGTMMALQVAPRREASFAGVVGFSGRLLEPEKLAAEAKVQMPIQLLHGNRDDVVPFDSMQEAADALVAADFDVYTHVMEGTPHGISPDGLQQAFVFMNEFLPK
ncbi:dienelactone hydrolase family protein [Alphaproteobacteria bacterium KMM 3653]|uniref:Dienelactone hydrolase family protein n=1 Tax=Harenicola maris TaxID=2841044 RepID=A0AAP2CNS5_9RHOB|nr:dienelactone hydrolase family protein [Harenicola maris]